MCVMWVCVCARVCVMCVCVCVCVPCVNEDCGGPWPGVVQQVVPWREGPLGHWPDMAKRQGGLLQKTPLHTGGLLLVFLLLSSEKNHGKPVDFPESSCAVPVRLVLHSLSLLGHPISQQYLWKLCCKPNSSIRFHEIQRNKQNNPCLWGAYRLL